MKAARSIVLSLGLAAAAAGLRGADSDPGEATPPATTAAAPAENGTTTAPSAAASGPTSSATAVVPAGKTPPPPPLSPRFVQVRERIDALFRNRITTPPPIDARQNPFRPAGVFVPTVATPDGRTAPVEQPATDQVLLQEAMTTLKIGGVFEIKGRQHRTVNGRPYKEGDVIPAQAQGQPVYLKVKSLTPKAMTLALREAETTVTF